VSDMWKEWDEEDFAPLGGHRRDAQLADVCRPLFKLINSGRGQPAATDLQRMKQSFVVLLFLLTCNASVSAQTYSTTFGLTENPISENNRWINGKDVGLDWTNASTTPGLAIGRQSGSGGYDDATALVAGSWGPDQTVQAKVYTQHQNDGFYEEVELRLRSTLSPHINTGYEINFRCLKTSDGYMQIVRWNGLLGDFTYLVNKSGAQYGVANGDVVKATIIGNIITAYINGIEVARVTDSTYATGHPGMGFFLSHPTGTNGNYGFTSFMATGSSPSSVPSAATGETSGEGGCCFIATAAYRSPFAPEVDRLRTVRNRYLVSFRVGRDLMAVYDHLSHPLAVRIARSSRLRTLTRLALTPVDAWAGLFLWSPILAVTIPAAALSLVGLSAIVWRRRRRR
jgi:hypothetical protein